MKYIILLTFIVACFSACQSISAGSYPYAEVYKLNVNADTLIGRLKLLKQQDSSLIPPAEFHLMDGRTDTEGYWHYFYFFNRNKREIWFTWVRAESKNVSNFAFVSVGDGLRLGNWSDINKDLADRENDLQKRAFEDKILSRVKTANIK